MLPNVFDVREESNRESRGFTSDHFVVFDGVRRKAAVQQYSGSMEIRYVFDYTQNEVHRYESNLLMLI